MRFFDSHAHLDGAAFDADREAVLDRAFAAGVTDLVLIGASDGFDSNPKTLEIAHTRDHLYATVGIHPHDATQVDRRVLDSIDTLAADPKVVAIGEMGLDYYYDNSPVEAQQEAFRAFIGLAKNHRKPIVIHTRDAEGDTLRILKEEGAQEVGGIIHCFSGTAALAKGALDLGFVISFSGILTFKKAEEIREVASWVPRDMALVETDCPYLAPVPFRGRRNEPAHVVHTAQKLADIWKAEVEEVMERTGENAARLFGV
ncbi:MAG: TatD family hydrolase [Myxococcota bacterium]